MATTTSSDLKEKSCCPCDELSVLPESESKKLLKKLDGWKFTSEGKAIRRKYEVKDFSAGLEFLRRVGDIAEQEGHHPDLHLTNYRDVAIELTTHAKEGLTENDFVLAAKIDDVPVALKKKG